MIRSLVKHEQLGRRWLSVSVGAREAAKSNTGTVIITPRAEPAAEPATATVSPVAPIEASAPVQVPVLESQPEPVPTPVSRVRRPVGAFQGGVIGFLLASVGIGAYGYYYTLKDFQRASDQLWTSIANFQSSAAEVDQFIGRLNAVEAKVSELADKGALKKELENIKLEYRKLIDAEHIDYMDLKAHVWGIEQDVHTLKKAATTQIRIE